MRLQVYLSPHDFELACTNLAGIQRDPERDNHAVLDTGFRIMDIWKSNYLEDEHGLMYIPTEQTTE